jgi:hypothetical protein
VRRFIVLTGSVVAVLLTAVVVIVGMRIHSDRQEDRNAAAAREAWPRERAQLLAAVGRVELDSSEFRQVACDKPAEGERCWETSGTKPTSALPAMAQALRAAGLADVKQTCDDSLPVPAGLPTPCSAIAELTDRGIVMTAFGRPNRRPPCVNRPLCGKYMPDVLDIHLGANLLAP